MSPSPIPRYNPECEEDHNTARAQNAESVRPDKPMDAQGRDLVHASNPPGFCRPGLGCRHCWPDQCKWEAAQIDGSGAES